MMIGFETYKRKWQVESEQTIKLGLESMNVALHCLGNPHQALQFVHIAGTNGKGSTLTFIESIARQHGLKVGKFMSPCIVDIHDQIQVDGVPISSEQMDVIFKQIKQANLSRKCTDFELLTVIALLHFYHEKVDLVLLEAGMGGLLDSTNIVTPITSVITSIALEHTNFLGNTLAEIARHKAGIIKQNRPVIVGRMETEAMQVMKQKANLLSAPFVALGDAFQVIADEHGETYVHTIDNITIHNLQRKMVGPHQADNMALAITAFLEVAKHFKLSVDYHAICQVIEQASIAGRFEQVWPNVYFDGAHNPASANMLVQTIQQQFPQKQIRFIVGMLADKDVQSVLQILEQISDEFIFVDFQNSRAMDAKEIYELSHASQKNIVQDIVSIIRESQPENTVTIVTGSLYLLAEIRANFKASN